MTPEADLVAMAPDAAASSFPMERACALIDAGWSPCVQAVLELCGPVRAADLRRCAVAAKARLAALVGEADGWVECDARHVPSNRDDATRDLCCRADRRAVSLGNAPLWRVRLVRRAAGFADLIVTLSARAADAATLDLLCEETLAAYAGRPLARAALSYVEVCAWQQSVRDDAEGRLYWRLRDRSAAAGGPLPFDDAARVGSAELTCIPIDMRGATGRIRRAIARRDETWPAWLLACWQVVCWRLTGAHATVGAVVPSRKYPELEDVLGPLDRTVPADVSLRPAMTIGDVVRTVAQAWHGAIEWQEHFDAPHSPVAASERYDLGFAHRAWRDAGALPSRARLVRPVVDIGARLTLTVVDTQDTDSRVVLQFDRGALAPAAARRLGSAFVTVLEEAVARPHAHVDEIALLTAAERDQLLYAWNFAKTAYPRASIPALFEVQARRTPDAIAVVYGRSQLSYAGLDQRANRLAAALVRRGVRRGELVGLRTARSVELIVGTLGILKAGAAYLPLDLSYPRSRLALMVSDSGTRVIVADERLSEDDADSGVAIVDVHAGATDTAADAADCAVPLGPDDLAYVMYTSGSTGSPKGVCISHRGVIRLLFNNGCLALTALDVVAQASSASFDAATLEIWGALLHGGRLVGIDRDELLVPESLAARLTNDGITTLLASTALFNEMGRDHPQVFRSLRYLTVGGEAIDPASCRSVLQDGGPARLLNLYGPTENTTSSSWYPIESPPPLGVGVPIGRPLSNTQLFVLGPHFQPVLPGATGELCLGGDGLAGGYLNRPALTAERFIADVFGVTPGGRLYRTGDRARWRPDGQMEFLGRIDHQIKVRGHRIDPAEIEVVLRARPAVADAIVMVREDVPGDRRLVAYVVASGAAIDVDALRRGLRDVLPEYMIPAAFVTIDRLPLAPTGKVDRGKLPAPAPDDVLDENAPPRTPAEEIVIGVWADVLRRAHVGVHHSFFDIGGDSLKAIRVLARLREAFGREIPMRTLFEHSTPATLAAELLRDADDPSSDEPVLERVEREGPLPASFGQERLWVVDQVTGTRAYHVPVAIALRGALDERALQRAVTLVAARHEVLRTTFGVEAGRPVQIVAPPRAVDVPGIDLSGVAAPVQAALTRRLLRTWEGAAFDLRHGPLWRVAVVRQTATTHVLAWTLHHIVADGWSVSVLLRDVAACYEAAQRGTPARLPALPVQYGDYAVWQRRLLAGARLHAQVAYWQTQLADVPALGLPTDRPRGAAPSGRGATVGRVWDAARAMRVQQWGRAHGATLFMVLLAAWQAVLARHAGQDDVAVGVPVAQRPRPELEGLIGFFLNTLVLRTRVDGRASWRTLVAQVRGHALAGYTHQLVPFEQVIAAVQPQRDLTRTPLFQVLFVLQNNPPPDTVLRDLQFTALGSYENAPKYEMVLHVTPRTDQIEWTLQYDASLFDRDTVEMQLQHLETFVDRALDAPDQPLASLSLLTDGELEHVTRSPRFPLAQPAIARDWSIEQSITDRFDEIVRRMPTRVAVRTSRAAWTYRDLSERTDTIAHAIDAGVAGAQQRIALLCDHDAPMIAAIFAVLKAGHAYVPLDPLAPSARLRQIWDDAEPAAIVTDDVCLDVASALAGGRPVIGTDTRPPDAPPSRTLPSVSPDAPAYTLYTSGSTGQPKGVVQSHRNVLHFIRTYATNLAIQPDDKLTLLAGYGFDAAVMDVFGALLTGATLHPLNVRDSTPADLADRIDEDGLTILHATPTVFRLVTASLADDRLLRSVRLVVLGGEAAYRADATRFARHFSPTTRLVNGLGPTESTVTLQYVVADPAAMTRHAIPVGHPVDETTIHLVDADGRDAEVHGEVVIESPYVALEYWRRPDLTRAAFGPGTALAGRRYRTGDVARRLPDGSLEFLGRKDRQLKVHGCRVEPGDIEAAIVQHPDVREAVVSAHVDAAARPSLVAYVVPRGSDAPSGPALRRFVAARLPEYMVPSAFIAVASLPLLANGKVDLGALPRPSPGNGARSGRATAPRDEREAQLAGLWREVLGVDAVSVEDNFFDLGGDSIAAIRCAARARAAGVPMTARLVFQHQTIAALASVLAPHDESTDAPSRRVTASTTPPPAVTSASLAALAARVQFEQ